jgi:hypothetical protein
MSVDNPNVVDIVGVPPGGTFVALIISDHLDWVDSQSHLLSLQAKLNRYFAFVEAGELLEKYPSARGKRVRTDIVFKHSPPSEAKEFLVRATAIAKEAAFELTWRLGPSALN